MTRSERERQIDRYISGGMSPAEEQDFFIQAALDKELRLELKALVTVDSAIRKDRDAEPAEHTALRSRVAAMLAAAPPAHEPAPSAVPRPTAPAPGAPSGGAPAGGVPSGSAPAAGALQKILPIQWISLAAATIALTAVLFLIMDRPATPERNNGGYERSERFRDPQPAPAATPAAPGKEAAPAASTSAAGSAVADPLLPGTAAPRSTSRNPAAMPQRENDATAAAERRTSATTRESSTASRPDTPDGTLRQQEGSGETAARAAEEARDDREALLPSKRGSDTLSVGVKVRVKNNKEK